MSDKMRAEFEARVKAEQGLDLTRLPHGGYRSFGTHQAWWAWQASRATLVIELPEQSPESPFSKHMVMDSSSVIEAIEAAGVRVKP